MTADSVTEVEVGMRVVIVDATKLGDELFFL